MNVEILPFPNQNGFFVCFPGEKDERKIEAIFTEIMADLIQKHVPKPVKIITCDKTGDYYFLIQPRKLNPALLEDLEKSLARILTK